MLDVYMTDSAVWVRSAGTDQWGDPLPPVRETVRCRIDWRTKLVIGPTGEQEIASGVMCVKQRPSHEDNYEVDGANHIILRVDEKKVYGRLSHYEVWLQ